MTPPETASERETTTERDGADVAVAPHRDGRALKVLIVSAFPPDPAPEANHALHLSEHLAGAGVVVDVLARRGSIDCGAQNVTVHAIVEDWTWRDLPRIARCMRRSRPDVVLLVYLGWIYDHSSLITFLPTICRAVVPGVPCVTQFEAIDEPPRRSFGARVLRNVLELWGIHARFGTLLRDSARIIALSSPHRDRLLAYCPEAAEKAVVIPPPPLIRFCDDEPAVARQRARDAIGATASDFVLVYFGYIYPGKGVETLLQAFQIAYRQNPDLRLVLVGGSLDLPRAVSCADYFHMVRRLPGQLGIGDRVTWTGQFAWDRDEGSRYLHAGDACVLPFDYGVTLNNSSLAAASRHGLPVIATELPAGRDDALAHGRNIYLCRPQDPEILAEAIELISGSAGVRERLRAGILALARDWHTSDGMTARLVQVLDPAARDHAPRPGRPRFDPDDDRWETADGRQTTAGDATMVPTAIPAPEPDAFLVSIVVAVHDVEEYLSQCLDSLVNQTLREVEIIVVDDASTDDSRRIVDGYAARYPNVRVIGCPSNKGLASVRNLGMEAATGEYVGFLDGDDWADVRMCELMYRHARERDADVVIGSATVFYEDSRTFAPLFDRYVHQTLPAHLKGRAFDLSSEPRVLLVEPVAWTKLYRRSFLRKHGLRFEDGMNSYEDMCFHVSVLVKAERMSILDHAGVFYRQNRPGQISGRTDRRVFEVFEVFDRIYANLSAWNVADEIWGFLVTIQIRQFHWLLKSRVVPSQQGEFLAAVATHLRKIPARGVEAFARHASADELARWHCMRANRLRAYQELGKHRWPLARRLSMTLGIRPRNVKLLGRRCAKRLRRRLGPLTRPVVDRVAGSSAIARQLQAMQESLHELRTLKPLASPGGQPLVEVCEINGRVLVLSHPTHKSGLGDALWRMANDYYLAQMAVFREGDVLVDVGAHVGVTSIYLAMTYPFIRVYAIEPDPLNHACLERNIALNGVRNVTVIHKAVAGDGRGRRLYSSPRDSGWATIDVKLASSRRNVETAEVDSVTLEQLFQEYGIEHCRLLKMTAPGAIREALDGLPRAGGVDLLCGEVDLGDCSRAKLEMASWRIARHHFWRLVSTRHGATVHSWTHQLPRGCESGDAAGVEGAIIQLRSSGSSHALVAGMAPSRAYEPLRANGNGAGGFVADDAGADRARSGA